MGQQLTSEASVDAIWREIFMTGERPHMRRMRRLYRWVPSEPRCAQCNMPFGGIGGALLRFVAKRGPSRLNPRTCNDCELFAQEHPGGAEVDVAVLFADVRGSTALAERVGARAFGTLIDKFYSAATHVLIDSDAMIGKLAGDQVQGFYFPGLAGPNYTNYAIDAARELLRATGHDKPDGPWVPVGVGVHKGRAYAGAVGKQNGMMEITALGDAVNAAARLAQVAEAGEILISDDALDAAGVAPDDAERRELSLRGRSAALPVRVIRPWQSPVIVGA